MDLEKDFKLVHSTDNRLLRAYGNFLTWLGGALLHKGMKYASLYELDTNHYKTTSGEFYALDVNLDDDDEQ